MTKTLTIVIKQELGIIKIVTEKMVTLRRKTTAKKKETKKRTRKRTNKPCSIKNLVR